MTRRAYHATSGGGSVNHGKFNNLSVGACRYFDTYNGADGLAESWVNVPTALAGRYSHLQMHTGPFGGVDTTSTVRCRVNGADGAQAISITTGLTGFFIDTSGHDDVTVGDLVNVHIDCTSATTGSFPVHSVSMSFKGTSTFARVASRWENNLSTTQFGGTIFRSLVSTPDFNAEPHPYTKTKLACSAFGMYMIYTSVSGTNNTAVAKFRKNGVDGNQITSAGDGLTGTFQDTTHTDTLAADDEFDHSHQITTGSFFDGKGWGGAGVWFDYGIIDFKQDLWSCRKEVNNVFNNFTFYFGPDGSISDASGTESDVLQRFGLNGTWSNMYVNIQSNTFDQPCPFVSRLNGSDGNLLVSVAATVTGYIEDTTHSDVVSDTMNISIKSTNVATTGGVGLRDIGGILAVDADAGGGGTGPVIVIGTL